MFLRVAGVYARGCIQSHRADAGKNLVLEPNRRFHHPDRQLHGDSAPHEASSKWRYRKSWAMGLTSDSINSVFLITEKSVKMWLDECDAPILPVTE